jgi:ligand-binding SRPBCC domain-containing protein
MPIFQSECIVHQSLADVWARFQDVEKLLPAMTPPQQGLVIERVEPRPPVLGTKVFISTKSPIGRVRWIAEYVEFVPPHATVTGDEARFVDLQIKGPFKYWRHTHAFAAIDDHTTRCTDMIDYKPPLGPLGWIGDIIIIRPALKKMFAYRAKVMSQLKK